MKYIQENINKFHDNNNIQKLNIQKRKLIDIRKL